MVFRVYFCGCRTKEADKFEDLPEECPLHKKGTDKWMVGFTIPGPKEPSQCGVIHLKPEK